MRISVMGAGSTGGYFGGMLARAGNDVSLIARGDHLAAIRTNGLRVVRDDEEFTVQCPSTDDPKTVGPVDLVLLNVKTYQNEQAIIGMSPLIGTDTSVLCLQNGIDSYQAAARAFGDEKVLPGAAYIEAGRLAPGVVRQAGGVVSIVFGEVDGSRTSRSRAILETLTAAGIPGELTTDIRTGLWSKFLFIATMAGITSLARQTLAELMPRPEWRDVVQGCLREIESVGRASGVDFPQEIYHETVSYIDSNLADLQASMHSDLMAGRPLELEALNGAVVRAGRAAGVPTPINDVIYAMLKPLENGTN
jgi:2-dehydropantoate 2-reductase